jgi:16S rRNA (guanine527-N7)-methyltransferase
VKTERLNDPILSLPADFAAKMTTFCDLLLEWNTIHNLSGATTEKEVEALIYDSVYPLRFLGSFGEVLDIGSGAGFPAIPLACARPECAFTLVEPTKKRVAFLNYVAIKLRLKNVTIHDKRIEAMPPHTYSLITSKAVMSADRLFALTKGMMDENSRMLLYKGRKTEEETTTIPNLQIVDADHSRYLLIQTSAAAGSRL